MTPNFCVDCAHKISMFKGIATLASEERCKKLTHPVNKQPTPCEKARLHFCCTSTIFYATDCPNFIKAKKED